MTHLALSLLGPMQVTRAGQPITGLSDKLCALLVYLVSEADRPHRRDALVGLLWADSPEDAARHSLRQTLLRLRRAIGDHTAREPFLLVTRETVQFTTASDHEVDVASFTALLAACAQCPHRRRQSCVACAQRLEQAVLLYRGDFLEQFFLPGCDAFEEWARLKRDRLHRQGVKALVDLVDYHEWRSSHLDAQRIAQRWVELEPWSEEAHQRLMRLFALNGERSAALHQYDRCRGILDQELGVEPSAETTALYHRIRSEDAETPIISGHRTSTSTRRHNLAAQPMPCIGREAELAEISELLANPECRLLTLAGLGGIGKTRLAMEVAARHVNAFADGVFFVGLAAARAIEFVVPAIADALNLSSYGRVDLKTQLLAYLHERNLLLVLDNFEHLLDGVDLLVDILQRAPAVKLLVTSREMLNIRWEWPLQITGLPCPTDEGVEKLEMYSAPQLFLELARRAQPRFALPDEQQSAIARICQLVEGMPLAIEFAAAWTRTLTCQDIAARITANLDVLTTSLRDVPDRHRSVRSVLDQSWNALTPEERHVLRQLSVFQGGFRSDAAAQVAGASPVILSTLVGKSFLHKTPSGRYTVHGLVCQYASDKLCDLAEDARQVHERHCTYYAGFVQHWGHLLTAGNQKEALTEIGAEIENIRAGWEWAVEQARVADIERYAAGLVYFYELRGWYQEGEALFMQAMDRIERLRVPADDSAAAEGSTAAYDRVLGHLLTGVGIYCMETGRFEQAHDHLQRSLALFRCVSARKEQVLPLAALGYIAGNLGEYTQGQHWTREALAIATEIGNRWGVATSFGQLGHISRAEGKYTKAKHLYQQSLRMYRANNDQRGIAIILVHLGIVALAMQAYGEAQRLFREALSIVQEIDDHITIVFCLNQLGHAVSALGAYHEAKQYYCEAIRLGRQIQAVQRTLDALIGMAVLWAHEGQNERALELVSLALSHPACLRETRDRAEKLRAVLETQFSSTVIAKAKEHEQASTIEVIVEQLLAI